MASYRHVFVVLLALVAVTAAAAAHSKNDVTVGTTVPGDHLLAREHFKASYKLLRITKIRKTFNSSKDSKIKQVRLLDQTKNGRGAKASLISGGPGTSYVTVEFISQRGRGIDYIVELYGR